MVKFWPIYDAKICRLTTKKNIFATVNSLTKESSFEKWWQFQLFRHHEYFELLDISIDANFAS